MFRADDGAYHDNLLLIFYIADVSNGKGMVMVTDFLTSRGLSALPATGGPPGTGSRPNVGAGLLVAVSGVALAISALSWPQRRADVRG